MTTYVVLGCLGIVVGRVSTIPEAVQLVQAQVPISTKTSTKLLGQLGRLRAGGSVEVDYGGSGCTVLMEEAI